VSMRAEASRSNPSGRRIQAHAQEITDDRAPGHRGGGQTLSFGLPFEQFPQNVGAAEGDEVFSALVLHGYCSCRP